jgi:hypothetical protein
MEGINRREVMYLGVKKAEFGNHKFGVDMNKIGIKKFHLLKNPVPFVEFRNPVFFGNKGGHGRNPDDLGIALPFLAGGGEVRFRIGGADDEHLMSRLDKAPGKGIHRYGNAVYTGPVGVGKHYDFHVSNIA